MLSVLRRLFEIDTSNDNSDVKTASRKQMLILQAQQNRRQSASVSITA